MFDSILGLPRIKANTGISQTHTSTSGAGRQVLKSPLSKPTRLAQSMLLPGIQQTHRSSRVLATTEEFACTYSSISLEGNALTCTHIVGHH